MNAYNQMIASEENTINMVIAKVIFLGPPKRGKTITRRRLFGEIVNISEEKSEQASTGVIDAHTFVMKQSTVRSTGLLNPGDNWRSITMLKDEKQLLCKLCHWAFSQENKNVSSNKEDSSTQEADHEKDSKKTSTLSHMDTTSYDNVHTGGAVNELPETSQDKNFVNDTGEQLSIILQTAASDSPVDPNPPFKAMDSDTLTEKDHVKDFLKTPASPDSEDNTDIIDISDAIDDKTMDSLPDSFQKSCLVYLQDTGGQPELMDMLPALTIGPALYLLFCRLNDKLNDTFEVRYRHPSVADKGGNRDPSEADKGFKSKLCLSDYILTIFSSIFWVHQAEEESELNNEKRLLSKPSKPIAYIIGTYKDDIKEDEIQKFDNELQEIIRKTTKFFEEGLIKFKSKSQKGDVLVYPIDNKFGNVDEILKLQTFLQSALEEDFEKVKIPACWLAFNLTLRSKNEKILLLTVYILWKEVSHEQREH